MPDDKTAAAPQGWGANARERLPMPAAAAMNDAQRAAAQALIDGPRKGVYGPFLPLLRSPVLLDRVGKVGEYLRFESVLHARIRELVTCFVARHVSNQFEWQMHAPLAVQAGVAQATVDAIAQGARPKQLPPDEEAALDFAHELLVRHGTSDAAYEAALTAFGEQGVVELATLVGYFAMVSWLMNVARTPGPAGAKAAALSPLPW
jgi:4-carboxymuconolactone decarboxylase